MSFEPQNPSERSPTWLLGCLMGLSLLVPGHARAGEHDHILWTARWNHDGSLLAVGGVRALWVLDANTFEKRSLLPKALDGDSGDTGIPYMAVTRVAWHPLADRLAVSSQGRNAGGIYESPSGKRTPLTTQDTEFGRGVSWNPDGSLLAFTSDDRLNISKADGTLLHEIPRYGEGRGLTGVAWSPAGDRIVTIGARITLHTREGKPFKQVMHRPEARDGLQLLLSVAWHPSGEFFVVGDYGTETDDPVLQFWSAEGELMRSITLEGDAQIRNLSWNREGTQLASASSKLAIWTRDGQRVHEAQAPELLWGVDWHPDGNTIVTSSIKGRLTLWSPTAEVLKEIVAPPVSQPHAEPDRAANEIKGHEADAVGPDRQWMVEPGSSVDLRG